MANRKRKRDLKAAAFAQLEAAARSQEDFEKLVHIYDEEDKLRERRERRNEIPYSAQNFRYWNYWKDEDKDDPPRLENLNIKNHTPVIPPPFNHVWWRLLMRGEFLDFIYDCPFEIEDLTSFDEISEILSQLNGNQREVFYYRVIKQYSNRRIAKIRGQTDRNIRMIYDDMIAEIRVELGLQEPMKPQKKPLLARIFKRGNDNESNF